MRALRLELRPTSSGATFRRVLSFWASCSSTYGKNCSAEMAYFVFRPVPVTPPVILAHLRAYHKGSCDIVPQAPLFVKPGTFDEFSTGNRILPAG